MITQTEIQKLQKLRKEISQLQAEETSLRSRVLQKHNNFDEIEFGPLSVEVSSQQRRVFTHKALLAGVGRDMYRELKANVTPTKFQVVKIVESTFVSASGFAEDDSEDEPEYYDDFE